MRKRQTQEFVRSCSATGNGIFDKLPQAEPALRDRQRWFAASVAGNKQRMGIGVSLLLIAAGAILIWAVDVSVSGLELMTVGWILLVVGLVGVLLSLIFWSSWGGPGRRETVVEERRA